MAFIKPWPQSSCQAAPGLVPRESKHLFYTSIELHPAGAALKEKQWPVAIIEAALSGLRTGKQFESMDFSA